MSLIIFSLMKDIFLTAQAPVALSLSNPKRSVIALTVVNKSNAEVVIWKCGFYPNHSVRLTDVSGNDLGLSEKGRASAKAFGFPGRDKNVPVRIAAGGRYTYKTPPLLPLFNVTKPGTYFAEVHYLDKVGGPPELRTGKVRIEIRK